MINEMEWLARDRQQQLLREVEQVRLHRLATGGDGNSARRVLRRLAHYLHRGQLGPAREADWRSLSPRAG